MMMRPKIFILFVFYILSNLQFLLHGSDFYFRNISVEDGLSQNMVYSIFQDKTGFIWFGTMDGLNRYDGIQYRIFKNERENPKSISSNRIFSILQDEENKIWIGTANGIDIYDPINERFTKFDTKTTEGNEIKGVVRDLKSDQEGNIWMAVQDQGIFCYNQGELKEYALKDVHVREILFDKENNIWVATYGYGLLKIDPESHKTTRYLLEKTKINSPENNINSILLHHSKYILVGTEKKGLQKFDIEKELFIPCLEVGDDGKELFVRCIMKSDNNELWVGTETGLYIIDLLTERHQNLKHSYNDPYSLSDNAIHSLYQDREGGIWVGTFFGGVCYFNKAFSQFEKYYPIAGENSISGKSISEFCKDDRNTIWIGTEDAGLNWFNPVTKTFGQCKIPAKNIHSLLYDDQKLWVGTFSEGIYTLELNSGRIKSYANSLSGNTIIDNNVYSIYKDSTGKIWIGTLTGLQYYNKSSDDFTRVQEGVIRKQVNYILEDKKGILWFATIGEGIYSYNRFSDEWAHYPTIANRDDETSRDIICLLEDTKGRLWIGTEGAGIGIYDTDTKSLITFATTETGLPNDVIYKMIEDNKGNIWGSTNKGIFKLNPENRKVEVYHHNNGLLGDQFNYKSGFKDNNGKLYFGGVKGFVAFNPDNLNINECVPSVVFNSFQIQNKEVALHEINSPLKKSTSQMSSIEIPHNASVFSIGFSALSYVYPEGNMYAYKLEGRDDDWIYANQAHRVNYADLRPGNYTFKAKGANSDGIWNEEGISLAIKILPPWYSTVWAYLVYIAAATALIFYAICSYSKRTKRRNKIALKEFEANKERELYTAKIEFFTNITHEIRTPLSLIKIPLEDVIQDIRPDDTHFENLTIIQRNVNRLLKLINELMDFRKTEAEGLRLNFMRTEVIGIINDTIDRFRPSFDSNKITCKTIYSNQSIYVDVDREIFEKMLSNLLSNALKHAIALIEIEVSYNEEYFKIKIENDGDVIPDEYVEKIFEPLFKLNKNVEGTGIGLAFVKSLVELHQGTIYCDNTNPEKTAFVMTLPIKQEQSIEIFNGYSPAIKSEDSDDKISKIDLLEAQKQNGTPTILTVEDNKEFQYLLKKQLSDKYQIIQCGNGKEALDMMDKELIDIVICDIMMPVMDGLEFCKIIKEDLRFSHIPVILLTAKSNLESKIEGISSGADEYIEKPYSINYLRARIDNLLENRKKMQEAFKKSPEIAFKNLTHSKADEDLLKKLIEIINENLDNPELNIDKIANEMAVSRSTLYRKIKNVSELSPNDFIQLIRLKRSAELIKERKYQISEIAYMTGFSSPNYFSKIFFNQFGVNPKDF